MSNQSWRPTNGNDISGRPLSYPGQGSNVVWRVDSHSNAAQPVANPRHIIAQRGRDAPVPRRPRSPADASVLWSNPRGASPHWETDHHSGFPVVGTHPSVSHGVDMPFVGAQSSSRGSSISFYRPTSQRGEDIHYIAPSPRASNRSSANFYTVVAQPHVNLVRRYAPHSVQSDIEFTDRGTPVAHPVSLTLSDNPAFQPASYGPRPPRSTRSTTPSGSHLVRPRGDSRGSGMPFRTHAPPYASTTSDSGSDSDSGVEHYYTPRTSPQTSTDSAFVPEDIFRPSTSDPATQSRPSVFVSSPPLQLVRSPSPVRSAHSARPPPSVHSLPYFGPYIPSYPTPPPSIAAAWPLGNTANRTNWQNPVVPPTPTSRASSSHRSSTSGASSRSVQSQSHTTIHFTIGSVGTINTIHEHPGS